MTDARPAPHDLDAERSALGSVFIKQAALQDLADLATDDFFLPAHRDIVEAVRAVAKRGDALDPVTVAAELKTRDKLKTLDGGALYLTELYNGTPTAENARHYARIVHEKATLRRLQQLGAEIMSGASADAGDIATLLGEVRRKLAVIDAGVRLGTLTEFRDIADDVLREIERRQVRFKETGDVVSGIARFGIESLDTAMAGIQIGDLGIIAAETSGGKTALAMQALFGVALAGGTGMAINLEMPKAQLAERALAHVARVNSMLLRTGQQAPGIWDDLTAASEKLVNAKLFLEDDATTLPQICAKARQWRARNTNERALLVVDFAQLIRGATEKGLSRAQQVGMYGQELKALAKELRIAIILVSQINREGAKKTTRPSMFDLKESGDLENAADWIVIIHNQCENPTGDDPVKFYLDKNRNGAKAQREGWWTGRWYRFTDTQPHEHRGETRFADAD
jgi:replicative DNA helicase